MSSVNAKQSTKYSKKPAAKPAAASTKQPVTKQTTTTSGKDGCPYVLLKDGKEVGVCGAKPVGRTKMTERQHHLGVPCDDKGYTGSTVYCHRHQIFEDYWPYCDWCQYKRVSFDAKGKTAGYCFQCINDRAYEKPAAQNLELSDPILDETAEVKEETASPGGAWTTVVKKSEKKTQVKKPEPPKKEDFPELSPIKAKALMSEAVKEAQRQAEASRLAALAAEVALKQAVATEELRIATELSQKMHQKEKDNTEALAAAFAAGFSPQLTEELLAVIHKYHA